MPPSGKRPNARGQVGQATQRKKAQLRSGLNFRTHNVAVAHAKANRLKKTKGLPKKFYGDPTTKTKKVSKKAYDSEQGRLKAAVGRRKTYNAQPASKRTYSPKKKK